jgi:hypothetical protein
MLKYIEGVTMSQGAVQGKAPRLGAFTRKNCFPI